MKDPAMGLRATVFALLLLLTAGAGAGAAQETKGAPAPDAAPEVRALLDQGSAAEKRTDNEAAGRLYTRSLEVARERKDRPGEAAALARQGRLLLFDAPAKARDLLNEALPIYQAIGDRTGEAACRFYLGNCAALLGKDEEALTHYDDALRLYRAIGGKRGEALTLLRAGGVHREARRPSKALPYFEQALPLFVELGDKGRQGIVLLQLGNCRADVGDTAGARRYYEQARPLAHEAGDKNTEALILHNLAGIYGVEQEYHRAIETFRDALPLIEVGGNRNQVASCLDNMSLMAFRIGDFLKALEYADRALTLQREERNPRGIVRSLDTLATVYSYLGQHERALDLEREALRTCDGANDPPMKAQVLSNLGRTYGKLGRAPEERDCLTQSLALYRTTEDRRGEAFVLHFLATNSSRAGDRARAEVLEEQSRRLFEALHDRHGVATTLVQSGGLAEEGGRFAPALEHYQKALALYQEIGYVFGEANTLARIGALKEQQGDLPGAAPFYEQALLRQESLRASLGGLSDAKSRYQEETFPLYRRYVRLLLETKQEAQAFAWVQRSKARALVDLMEAGGVPVARPMTADERRRADALRRRDATLSRQWLASLTTVQDLKRRATPDPKRLKEAERRAASIRQQQRRLEQDWRAFQEQRYLREPRLATARSARPVALDDVAAFLPEDTALLEYAILPPGPGDKDALGMALFVVTQKAGKPRLRVVRLKPDAAMARRARELRAACAGRPGTPAERPYRDAARDLYRRLIAPAEAALAGKRRLILCPDGPLWDVPFQALLTPSPAAASGTGSFLWDRYTLVYAYSATGMKAVRDARKRPDRPAAREKLLVLAAPDFGGGGSAPGAPSASRGAVPTPEVEARTLYLRVGGLGALPFTRVEADAIRAAYPDATLKTGSAANEEIVKQTGARYRYLHFATHAVFNDAAPLLSGVVLSQPPADSPEDGILTVRELFGLNLSADLLVLSACETAKGANRPGEGLVGLAWAAFVAGVPTQVVSQWSVDDAATARLMGAFYGQLKQGRAKDAALQTAARSLRRDGSHAHPFYWAPFLVLGDWR